MLMPKPVVFITRRLPSAVLNELRNTCDLHVWDEDSHCPRDVLRAEFAQAHGVLTQATDVVDAELLSHAPNLKVIAHFGVGYNNIDVAECTRRGIRVTNTPGVLTETTADMGFALLMAAARRVVEGQKCIEAGEWKYAAVPLHMAGQDVFGATLGVVGAGRIGSGVLRRGHGFNMKLRYHNRNRAPQLEAETGAEYRALDDLLRECDFVVMCAPLTSETRGMFGAHEFALMKNTAVFVNISRGQAVKEAELVEALKQGRPWAAGLDVYEVEPTTGANPLLSLPNVVCTPHCGSSSVATRTGMGMLCAKNLLAYFANEPLTSAVN